MNLPKTVYASGENMKQITFLLALILLLNSCMPDFKFLNEIDLSDGDYSLYVRHKEFGEFMVIEEKALKENSSSLKLRFSFVNYLPGEGDRNFGVILFKNNQQVKSKIGGAFTYFEIGSLANYALAVKEHRISGIKKVVQRKLDSIKNKTTIFINHQPTFVADNRAFRFRVYFPSIALPVTREIDSTGYERIITVNGIDNNKWIMEEETIFDKQWENKLENRIRKKADTISDFEVKVSKGSLSDDMLYDTTVQWGDLRTPDSKPLFMKDYMYYNFTAYIMASEENAKKLLVLDYSDCMNDEERNKPQVLAKMKQLVKKSTKPNLSVDKGEVGLQSYKDDTTTYEGLYEQEYSLNWFEIEKNND